MSLPDNARDWQVEEESTLAENDVSLLHGDALMARYGVRALADETGISKSQVSLALRRCLEVGLVRKDRKTGVPRANAKALFGCSSSLRMGCAMSFPPGPPR